MHACICYVIKSGPLSVHVVPPFRVSGESGNSVLAALDNKSLTNSTALSAFVVITVNRRNNENNHLSLILCSILRSPTSVTTTPCR